MPTPTQQAADTPAAGPSSTPGGPSSTHKAPSAAAPRAADLLARFRATRAQTLHFCAPLSAEDMMVQSCPEASPVKWHIAHTSWFFETFVLADFVPGYQPFHADFRWLFNSYYNAVGDMPEKKLRASFSRPPLDAILAYRAHVDAAVVELLQAPGALPEEAARRIVLGLEHEQQHLELAATDIKHALFTNPLQPAYLPLATGHGTPGHETPSWPRGSAAGEPVSAGPQWIAFNPPAPGIVDVGVSPDADDLLAFAFDNETPRHPVYLAPFALASRLVTCAEYLAFLNDSAYSRPELWLSAGWDAVRAGDSGQPWQAPLYWRRDAVTATGWSVYTLRGWQPLDALLATPVCHLSLFEADAFARWAALTDPGCRLPTEFELEYAMAEGSPQTGGQTEVQTEDQTEVQTGGPTTSQAANFLEAAALHPRPASADAGVQQLFGDVWEWTQSPYTGYPGYAPLPGALGEYNGKFMSSQMVLRGGSCVTPATHIRATYRNFFPPATRWQFSGLRLAHSAVPAA